MPRARIIFHAGIQPAQQELRAAATINKAAIIGVIRNQGREYRIGFLTPTGPQEGTPDQCPHRAFRIRVQPIQQQHARQLLTHLGFHAKGLRKVPRVKLRENNSPNLWRASGEQRIHLVQSEAADIGNLPLPRETQAKLELILIQTDFPRNAAWRDT